MNNNINKQIFPLFFYRIIANSYSISYHFKSIHLNINRPASLHSSNRSHQVTSPLKKKRTIECRSPGISMALIINTQL